MLLVPYMWASKTFLPNMYLVNFFSVIQWNTVESVVLHSDSRWDDSEFF